jgi:hypothetical protein
MSHIEQYLEVLRCPACRASVGLTPDRTGLRCTQCRRIYPIKDEIPQMIVEEAVIAPDDASPPSE